MKKTFIILIILLQISSIKSSGQGFFGLQAGLNLSSLSSTDLSSLKTKAGYHAGLIFNFSLIGTHFTLMPSLLYSTKGFQYEYKNEVTSVDVNTTGDTVTTTVNALTTVNATLGYLDIPAMFTYIMGEDNGIFIQAGPQLSFLITDKATVASSATASQNGGQPQPTTSPVDNSISFNPADVSLVGGIGYKLPKVLLFYFRASSGFLKVQKDGFVSDSNGGHNLVYQIGAALTF